MHDCRRFSHVLSIDESYNRLFQNYVSNANPDTLAAMGAGGMPPDMIKTATDMISKMKPEELQKMLEVASSLNGKAPNFPSSNGDGSTFSSQVPQMTPEMIKMASDKMRNMSPEELQKMIEVASSMNGNGTPFPKASADGSGQRSENGIGLGSHIPEMTPEMIKMASDRMKNMSPEELQKMFEIASSMNPDGNTFPNSASDSNTQRSESGSRSSTAEGSHMMDHLDIGESSSGELFSSSRSGPVSSSVPVPSVDLQESLRNSMKDPEMRQV